MEWCDKMGANKVNTHKAIAERIVNALDYWEQRLWPEYVTPQTENDKIFLSKEYEKRQNYSFSEAARQARILFIEKILQESNQ